MPAALRRHMQVHVTWCDPYRIRVTTWGTGAPPHCIVLPGLSADWRALAPQIRLLRGLGGTVHVVDLPGFALGPPLRAADATVDRLAGYVACVAEDLAIPRALVLGHSLGGGVAMHFALSNPERVSGLVLIAPVGLGVSLHWIYKLYCLPLLGRVLLRPRRALGASSIRRFLVGSARRTDPRFVARLVRHGQREGPRTLSARAVIWANQPRRWQKARGLLPGGEQLGIRIDRRLKELSGVPALVLWGDEDRVISARDARRCQELSLARVRIARGVGHSLPLEAAAWANEHITRFVTALLEPRAKAA
jgi:pyruvate dehydrogenase E2 component (dihydrolipoamide acetyltransferase)